MTVPVNDRRIQYTATASQTVFPYDFKITVNTEIVVLQTIKLTGVTNTLVLTTDYTVSNVGTAGGGDITLVTGAAVDDTITITGATALSRVTDFNQAGDFLMSDLNDQLDKLTDILQENTTDINRSVKLKAEDTTTSMEIPIATDRASKFLGFDASGNAIAAAGTTEVPVSAFMETLLDDTTAAAARSTLGVTGTTINIGTLAGAADTYTATSTASYTAYTAGDEFLFKVNVDNTGASTINVSSAGVKALEKFDGAGAATALEAGDIQADQYYKGVYNGTAVIVLNPEKPYLSADNITISAATTISSGTVELLTNAELAAGTDTTRAATAASTLSLYDASTLATDSCANLPVNNGGAFSKFMIQGGTFTAGGGYQTETLPQAFPNAFLFVSLVQIAGSERRFNTDILSLSQFRAESISVASTSVRWIAIGY